MQWRCGRFSPSSGGIEGIIRECLDPDVLGFVHVIII
jgi:hypothetical protein